MSEIDGEPRKGRAPAILTYEQVAEINLKLTRMESSLEGVSGKLMEMGMSRNDHEVRIRALELTTHGIVVAGAQSVKTKGDYQWIWNSFVAVAVLLVGLLNYLK